MRSGSDSEKPTGDPWYIGIPPKGAGLYVQWDPVGTMSSYEALSCEPSRLRYAIKEHMGGSIPLDGDEVFQAVSEMMELRKISHLVEVIIP